jgi:hypothetical protein
MFRPGYSWPVQRGGNEASAGVELASEGLRGERFAGDDGSADPRAAAALTAFAAGEGSELDALTALSAGRLLVPVVARLGEDPRDCDSPGGDPLGGDPRGEGGAGAARGDSCAAHPLAAGAAEKASEMALPMLVGADGRAAIPAFTSVASLARWRPDARPLPTEAMLVWQAAMQDSCAVVIDIAGPVPLAVEGARLAALATGEPPPPPHEDAEVRDAVAAIVAAATAGAGGFRLAPPAQDVDLLIELRLLGGPGQPGSDTVAAMIGQAVIQQLGGRLRRGIELAITG